MKQEITLTKRQATIIVSASQRAQASKAQADMDRAVEDEMLALVLDTHGHDISKVSNLELFGDKLKFEVNGKEKKTEETKKVEK